MTQGRRVQIGTGGGGHLVERRERCCVRKLSETNPLQSSCVRNLRNVCLEHASAELLGKTTAELKERVSPLMAHVRFGLMSGEDLAEKVMPTELVDITVTHDAFAAQFLEVKPTGIRHSRRSAGAIELLFPAQANEAAYRAGAAAQRSGLFWHLGSAGARRSTPARTPSPPPSARWHT